MGSGEELRRPEEDGRILDVQNNSLVLLGPYLLLRTFALAGTSSKTTEKTLSTNEDKKLQLQNNYVSAKITFSWQRNISFHCSNVSRESNYVINGR